jgi:mRNA interferase RelE/StbE
MIYKVEFSERAFKEFGKLDRYTQKLIYAWIKKHLVHNENPRSLGKPLVGNKSGQWRYRIGDYRLLCLIEDDKLIILVLGVGHRSKNYK